MRITENDDRIEKISATVSDPRFGNSEEGAEKGE
jgi:hypothetical protein